MYKTILIIEDEAEIADTLRYAVESEGMASVWVAQGKLGLEALRQQSIDMIILDVGLPDYNGFELLKVIRQSYEVPVMLLTARSDEVDKIVGLEIGADDYVTKPFSPREVVARVKAILKRSQKINSVSNQAFTINPKTRSVTYDGVALELTKSEYTLLSVLVASPGQIFSRRQLIDHVWSSQHPSDDRIIDTHIKTLRAKLTSVKSGCGPIVTHRGFGYALELG
jgi:two-component system catabolic regulation response regulator CreB